MPVWNRLRVRDRTVERLANLGGVQMALTDLGWGRNDSRWFRDLHEGCGQHRDLRARFWGRREMGTLGSSTRPRLNGSIRCPAQWLQQHLVLPLKGKQSGHPALV